MPSRTDRSWPSIASASRASRSRRSPPRTRRRRWQPWSASTSSTRSSPSSAPVEQALADDAPQLHDGPLRPGLFHGLGELKPADGNVCYRYRIDRGDIEARLRRRRARRRRRVHVPRRLPVRDGDAHDRRPGRGRRDHALGVVPAPVPRASRDRRACSRCRSPTSASSCPTSAAASAGSRTPRWSRSPSPLARKAGRPVRIANSVDESMVTTRRHGMRAGCARRRAARAGSSHARSSAGSTPARTPTTDRVSSPRRRRRAGPYRWEAVRVDASGVYTNTSPAGSYRAFGATHLQWIGELQVDEIAPPLPARRAGDATPEPLYTGRGAARRRQAARRRPHRRRREGRAAIGWDSERQPGIGRGVSVGLLAAGAHPVSSAVVRMEADGNAVVLVGSTEVGQGARTVFAQIVAEELGLPPERVTVRGADTRSRRTTARPAPAARPRWPVWP